MDIAAWLEGLGLGDYVPAFAEHGVDLAVLPQLTAADLKEIGVLAVGHRRRLLDAIAALREGPAPPPAPPPPTLAAASAERRQLTVLFCDLVGSTALAARLDPEDLREVMAAYHGAVAAVVARFEGFVAKYMGDGVLVYFGWPVAHEDDAERAVRAALELPAAVAALAQAAADGLSVRIGIATGEVVVGDLLGEGAAQERTVVGETPNLAARLQALAEPGAAVIAAGTRRLIGELFDCRDLGTAAVKGIAEPVRAFHVLRPSAVASRFEALHAGALTPLIGREEELELLGRRWRQAGDGEGRVVMFSGEPGIGKSRLTRAIQERLAGEPHTRLLYFCSPHHESSALFPFIGQLERAADLARDDPPERRLDKLETLLARSSADVPRDAAIVAELLAIPTGDRYPPRTDPSPQKLKEATFATLLAQLDGLARSQPVLMIFEDVHWIDPTSRELLDLTIDRVPGLPVLLIITFRPEFLPSWVGRPHVTMHPLSRLGRREAMALVDRVTGGKALPPEVAEQILARTDGVPLFVEELTKTLLESGHLQSAGDRYVLTAPLPALAIPTTLHASLMARLDRLAPVRRIAEIGAALGREFSHELLAAVADTPPAELAAALDQLVAAELIYRRGTAPDAVYSFKHALVQDAAYSTLLRGARQQLHARIAAALEQRFADSAAGEPELLAHHLTEAGLPARAIPHWQRAGERASDRSSAVEAVAHLGKALRLLDALPASPERDAAELGLRLELGAPLIVTSGFAADEIERSYLRARELCEALGRTHELFPVLRGLWHCYFVRGELTRTEELAARLVALVEAEPKRDPMRRAHAMRALGTTMFYRGRLDAACAALEQGIVLGDGVGDERRAEMRLYTDWPSVVCRVYAAICQWAQGHADRARASLATALERGARIDHVHTLSLVESFGAVLRLLYRDHAAALELADSAVALTRERSIANHGAVAALARGMTLIRLGQLETGRIEIERGWLVWHATGSCLIDTLWRAFRAELELAAGRPDAARGELDLAFEDMRGREERFYEAELLRLRARLELVQGDTAAAERALTAALEVARAQAARTFELRAATDLARLWQQQGRVCEARELLAPIHAWFTEGHDLPDLVEAGRLLAELGA